MSTSMTISLHTEIGNETLDALVKASDSDDSTEMTMAAANIPRLVIEVNRLRQERDDRVRDLNNAKRKIQEQTAYIEQLRPRAQAEQRLHELEDRVSTVVADAEKVTRERDELKRTVDALEKRVKTLLASLVEVARGTGAEKLAMEVQEARERAERAEAELAELRAER